LTIVWYLFKLLTDYDPMTGERLDLTGAERLMGGGMAIVNLFAILLAIPSGGESLVGGAAVRAGLGAAGRLLVWQAVATGAGLVTMDVLMVLGAPDWVAALVAFGVQVKILAKGAEWVVYRVSEGQLVPIGAFGKDREAVGLAARFSVRDGKLHLQQYDLSGEPFGEAVDLDLPTKWSSTDPYVGTTANAIELLFPERVVDVNRLLFRPDGSTLTDCDIELTDIVIQVKSGSGKGLTSQITDTMTGTDKIVIGYDPDLNPSSALVKDAKKLGYEIFTDLNDLLQFVAAH
jgi:hypothetical protein